MSDTGERVPTEAVLTHHGRRLSPETRAKVKAFMRAMWAIGDAEMRKTSETPVKAPEARR